MDTTATVNSLPFDDRFDAARRLARVLTHHAGSHALVLAIPRGAVPMARTIADALRAELDVVLVRKLRAPGQPELALGAIDEAGRVTLTPGLESLADERWMREEVARQREEIVARRSRLPCRDTPLAQRVKGRCAIVVDDGLATGATMVAALDWVRAQGPLWLVCAVPVAAQDSLRWAAGHADETVCPWPRAVFGAVSQYYRHFTQVSDQEVVTVLSGPSSSKRPRASVPGESISKG